MDYLILGQHALYNEVEGVYTGTPTTDERLLDRYVGQCIEGLETGMFSCLCHPDLMRFVGEEKTYARHMRRLCVRARELGIPLEINLLGIREGKDYPNPKFWRIAGEEGCPAVLGVDAHDPASLRETAAEQKARELAQAYQIPVVEELTIDK